MCTPSAVLSTVDHALSSKSSFIGFWDSTLSWFSSYFNGCKMLLQIVSGMCKNVSIYIQKKKKNGISASDHDTVTGVNIPLRKNAIKVDKI